MANNPAASQAQAVPYNPPLQRVEPALAYAPPAHRVENVTQIPVKDVETITKEITEVIQAAKDEIDALERDAFVVRSLYVTHTKRISAHIKRLRDGVKLSMETMQALHDQCRALDNPEELKGELEADIAEIASKFAVAPDQERSG